MKNFKQLFLFLVIILVGGTGGYYYRGSGGEFLTIISVICLLYSGVGTNSIDSNSVMTSSYHNDNAIDEFLKKF